MRCVLVTTRRHDDDLTSQLGDDGLPNLEIIHASEEELAQWFSLDRSNLPVQLDQEYASTASEKVAAP